jgi:hypothetical protein
MNLTKFSLLRRRAGLTPQAFAIHWRETHVEVLVHHGGHRDYNRQYLQNLVLSQTSGQPGAPVFDGIAQMTPTDPGVVSKGFQTDPRYARFVRPDEALFLDVANCVVAYAESTVLRTQASVSPRKMFLLYTTDHGNAANMPALQAAMRTHACLVQRSASDGIAALTLHRFLPDSVRGMAEGAVTETSARLVGLLELKFAPGQELDTEDLLASVPVLRVPNRPMADIAMPSFMVVRESMIYGA